MNDTSAFHSATRLSGALAFEALRERGWSAEDLVLFTTAVRGVEIEPNDDHTGVHVTLQWDQEAEVDRDLFDKIGQDDLPLFFCAFTGRREPPQA